MRVFRVSEFLGGAFVFAFLAILLAFVTRGGARMNLARL